MKLDGLVRTEGLARADCGRKPSEKMRNRRNLSETRGGHKVTGLNNQWGSREFVDQKRVTWLHDSIQLSLCTEENIRFGEKTHLFQQLFRKTRDIFLLLITHGGGGAHSRSGQQHQ